MCERCQLGVGSRVYAEGGVFAPIEAHIRHFNDWVLTQLGDVATDSST